MKDKMMEVVFLGYQEQIEGESMMLVNEVESHSTVKYDSRKHIIIDEDKKGGEVIVEKFNQYDEKGQELMDCFEVALMLMAIKFKVTFIQPTHDIARRLLNEIQGFEPLKEVIR